MDELIKKLLEGERGTFPMMPPYAANLIVNTLLDDLPPERREKVRFAIEEWGQEWGSSMADSASEDGRGY